MFVEHSPARAPGESLEPIIMNKTAIAVGFFVLGMLVAPRTALAQATLGACINSRNGNMRLAASASACLRGETFVQWNVQGVKGDKGDQGIQGPKGDQGDPGSQGRQG